MSMGLFLAIEFAEHIVVALASLFGVSVVMVGTAKHLVYFHTASAVNRGTG